LSGGGDCSEDDVAAKAARKASQLHQFEWSTQQRESSSTSPAMAAMTNCCLIVFLIGKAEES